MSSLANIVAALEDAHQGPNGFVRAFSKSSAVYLHPKASGFAHLHTDHSKASELAHSNTDQTLSYPTS